MFPPRITPRRSGEGGNIPPARPGSRRCKIVPARAGKYESRREDNAPTIGSGGCKTPEEVSIVLSASNPDVCKILQPSGDQQGEGDQNQDNRREMMPELNPTRTVESTKSAQTTSPAINQSKVAKVEAWARVCGSEAPVRTGPMR